VKIVEQYSHLNGYESIQYHQPRLWREIVDVIASVDAAKYRTKVSREKTMVGRKLYDPKALNKAMNDQFRLRKWEERKASFYVTRDAKLIRKTLSLQPFEQKREIEAAGEVAVRSYNQTDFVKNRIAVEVQFGKYFAVAYDMFVKHLAFYVGDLIDVGIEIVPVRAMSGIGTDESEPRGRGMSTGVPWYEKELYNLIREGRGVPSVPLVLIGVGP
jgi:hypothetical protein